MVATTFIDNAGITRVKSVPLDRLPQLAAWGVGASTSFDYFRFDDWLAAPPGGTAPVGDLRVIPDLRRLVPLAAQPGWAWTPGDRYWQDGEPHDCCNRLLLQRLVDDAAADGLEIKAAFEIEWVISAGDGDDFISAAVGPAYGMSRLVGVSDYARDLIEALERGGDQGRAVPSRVRRRAARAVRCGRVTGRRCRHFSAGTQHDPSRWAAIRLPHLLLS